MPKYLNIGVYRKNKLSCPTERDVEQALTRAVTGHGGIAWKFVSPGTAGVPDRIVLLPGGKTGFVELKAPGKKPRPLQERRMSQIRDLGIPVFVVDNVSQIEGVIREIQSS